MNIKEIWEQNLQHQYCKNLDDDLSASTDKKTEILDTMKPFSKSIHSNDPYERQRNWVRRNVMPRGLLRKNRFMTN